MTQFGTDQVLIYNVDPWNKLGFGVANFGDNMATQNATLHRLADEIGVNQLALMTHIDAQRRQYPSINTVKRLGTAINRIATLLMNRAKPANVPRLEGGHGAPSAQYWNIHPVPYFPGPIIANPWLKEYNQLVMMVLTNIYQHTDNNIPLTITAEFASQIWAYFREIKRLLAGELLAIKPEVYDSQEFVFTDEHYSAYNPAAYTISIEHIDDPGDVRRRFTEDDLQPFLRGIPANLIVPSLAQYPVSETDNFAGAKSTLTDNVPTPTVGVGGTTPNLQPLI